jgi:hypothetical protein
VKALRLQPAALSRPVAPASLGRHSRVNWIQRPRFTLCLGSGITLRFGRRWFACALVPVPGCPSRRVWRCLLALTR